MTGIIIVTVVLTLAAAFGWWRSKTNGEINEMTKTGSPTVNAERIGADLGERVTLLQFSSAFCAPCRTTRAILSDVAASSPGVVHVEIDAENNLDLVRELGVQRTPTTFVLAADGTIVHRAVGAPKRSDVLLALESVSA